MLPKSRRAESSGINLSAWIMLKELWTKENYAVNFPWSRAASYLTCRKTTGRVQSTQKTCDGILGWKRQIFEHWRKVAEKERCGEVAVACLCQAVSSAQHPSPLCRCKIQEAAAVLFRILWSPPNPTPLLLPRVCVCGWLQASSPFFPSVHMYIQGIAARIFKGTGAFTKWGGHNCPMGKNTQDSETICTIIPAKVNNHLNVWIFLWYSTCQWITLLPKFQNAPLSFKSHQYSSC